MRGVAALLGLMLLYPLGSCMPTDDNLELRRTVETRRVELAELRRTLDGLEARAATMTERCETYAAELGVEW